MTKLLFVFIIIFGSAKASPVYELINEYLLSGNFDSTYNFRIWNIASQILKQTRYFSKVRVNQVPNEGYVNIYVFDKDPEQYFQECNCTYLGEGNVIVCDKSVFEFFNGITSLSAETELLHISKEEATYQQIGSDFSLFSNANIGYFLEAYILGHELGHLMINHGTASFIRKDKGSGSISYTEPVFNNELQADSFSMKAMGNLENYDLSWVYFGMNQLISQIHPNALASWRAKDTSTIFLYSKKTEHPPLIYRLLQMAQIMLEIHKDVIFDNTGYYEFLLNKLELTDTATNIPFKCAKTKNGVDSTRHFENLKLDTTDLSFFFQRCKQFALVDNTSLINGYLSWGEKNIKKSSQHYSSFANNYNYYYGLIAYRLGDFRRAADYWKKVTSHSLLYEKAKFLRYFGMTCLAEGDFDLAKQLLYNQLENDISAAENWVALGIAHEVTGNVVSMENCYKIAAILDSNISEANVLQYKLEVPASLISQPVKAVNYRYFNVDFREEEFVRQNLAIISEMHYRSGHAQDAIRLMDMLMLPLNLSVLNQSELAQMKNFYAMCMKLNKKYERARATYLESLRIRKENLKRSGSHVNKFFVSQTLFNIGNLELEAWDNATAAEEAYEVAIGHLRALELKELPSELWYESLRIFHRIALEKYRLGKIEEGLRTLSILDTLSKNFNLNDADENEYRLKVINNMFFYFKRMLKHGPSARVEVINYLDEIADNARSYSDTSSVLIKDVITGCEYLKTYFQDSVRYHEINALDLLEEAQNVSSKNVPLIYLSAYIELDLALQWCEDVRFNSLLGHFLRIKDRIIDRFHNIDTLEKVNQIALRILLRAKTVNKDYLTSYSVDSLLSKIYGDIAYLRLISEDFFTAAKYAANGLKSNPADKQSILIAFVTKTSIDQLTSIKVMNINLVNDLLAFIDHLPELIKTHQRFVTLIVALKTKRAEFG